MIELVFFLLRLITALAALGSFAITLILILLSGAFKFLKDGFGVIGSVVTMFASGFQKSGTPPEPGSGIPAPLFGLAIMFLGMFISVFMPGQKIFLHGVAFIAAIAAIWEIWRLATVAETHILYLPVVGLWMIYYAVCLRRI